MSQTGHRTRGGLERVRLLQEMGKMQAAFAVWCQSAGVRKEFTKSSTLTVSQLVLSVCLSILGRGKIVAHMVKVCRWKTGISAEGRSTRRMLHNTLQKWTDFRETSVVKV